MSEQQPHRDLEALQRHMQQQQHQQQQQLQLQRPQQPTGQLPMSSVTQERQELEALQAQNQAQAPGPEDAVTRTVHIVGIDGTVAESVFAAFAKRCGNVVKAKICGDPRGRTLYGFVEFDERSGASRMVEASGTQVGATKITVSWARSAIRSSNEIAGRPVFDEKSEVSLLESPAYCPAVAEDWIFQGGKKGKGKGKGGSMGDGYGNRGGYGAMFNPAMQQQMAAQLLQAAQAARMVQAAQVAHVAQAMQGSAEARDHFYQMQVKKAYEQAGYSMPSNDSRDTYNYSHQQQATSSSLQPYDSDSDSRDRRRRRRDKDRRDRDRDRPRRRDRDRDSSKDRRRKRRRHSSSNE